MSTARTLPLIVLLTWSFTSFGQELNQKLVLKSGDQYFENEQYIKAIRFYKEVLDQSPGHVGAKFRLAECYRLTFDYPTALHFYDEVVQSGDDRFPLAHFQYANMLKLDGKYDEALQGFEDFHKLLVKVGLDNSDRYRHYYKQAKIELSLFDLDADVAESKNVIDDFPEVVKELQRAAEVARQDLGDKLTKQKGNGVRPVGKLQPGDERLPLVWR